MSGDLTLHRSFDPVLRRWDHGVTPTAEDPLAQREPTANDALLSVEKLRRDVQQDRNQDAAKFNASLERVAALERRVETLERLVRLERRVETLERLVRLLERVTAPVIAPAAPWPPTMPIVTCGSSGPFAGVVRDLQNVTAGQEHA